jgi:predicted flap endonuclease-1-like 5' DNA nuclease
MTYLLAKYTVLFLLTALLGFVLGYWFSRRKFVDVSESYEDLRAASTRSDAMHWDRLWQHLDSIPMPKETDLTKVNDQLSGVAAAISDLPRVEPVSFTRIEDRLESLQDSVRSIPVPSQPEAPNLVPLTQRLDSLERSIKAIPTPEKPAPVDLTGVNKKLSDLEQAVRSIPEPAPQRTIDLQPVRSELVSLRNVVEAIPVTEKHEPVDLKPVSAQLNFLQDRISTIARPQAVDIAPIDRRLTAIESQLGTLSNKLADRQPVARAPRKIGRREPRILSAALYGNKDDLKLISGVGPKLEKLLNKNGVFYFWQVAEWTHRDIDLIDERLDTFKGRIARDKWISQAKQLRRTPAAAAMPSDL